MRSIPSVIRLLCTIAMLLGAVSCGQSEPRTIENQKAFDDAVETYLQRKNMDLAIAQYKEFRLDDDGTKAEATIAMKLAGPGAKVTARFHFRFEKVDGAWRVTTHSQMR